MHIIQILDLALHFTKCTKDKLHSHSQVYAVISCKEKLNRKFTDRYVCIFLGEMFYKTLPNMTDAISRFGKSGCIAAESVWFGQYQ